MTIVSYAQNLEDVMLWRALGHVRHGFFIDVGAAWPVQDSVTRLFKDHHWTGINVEPNPELHRQLVEDRPDDINLMIAVSDERSTLDMDIVSDTGLSTLSSEIGGGYRSEGRAVTTLSVEVVTLADLWQQHVPDDQPVHFLKVDVEGFEGQVVAGADWNRHRPWVVVVEATRPTSQVESHDTWEPALVQAGYEFVYADGLNRFYVANEHHELMESFRYPPNIFDGFITAAHDAAERRAAAAEVAVIEAQHRADVTADALTKADARIEWMQSEWDAATARADHAMRSITELHRANGALDSQLGERERALASTTAQLHAAHQHAGELTAWNGRLQAEVHELRGEVDRQAARIAHLDQHIADMYASTSWRFARPVRMVGSVLGLVRQLPARLLQRGPGHQRVEAGRTQDVPAVAEPTLASAPPGSDLPPSASHVLHLLEALQAPHPEGHR